MQKLKSLLSNLSSRVALFFAAVLIVLAILPGFVDSEKSEESDLSPSFVFESPRTGSHGDDSESLGWTAAPDDIHHYSPPAAIATPDESHGAPAMPEAEGPIMPPSPHITPKAELPASKSAPLNRSPRSTMAIV